MTQTEIRVFTDGWNCEKCGAKNPGIGKSSQNIIGWTSNRGRPIRCNTWKHSIDIGIIEDYDENIDEDVKMGTACSESEEFLKKTPFRTKKC